MSRVRKWTLELLAPIVASSFSFSEVLRKIGATQSGGMHALVKSRVREYGLNFGHFTGRGSNRGEGHRGGCSKRTWENVLRKKTGERREDAWRLRRALIESGRKYRCEMMGCIVVNEWMGKEIRLDVDHINGNRMDNRVENLRFLCPNCHSQTANHSNRKGRTRLTSKI